MQHALHLAGADMAHTVVFSGGIDLGLKGRYFGEARLKSRHPTVVNHLTKLGFQCCGCTVVDVVAKGRSNFSLKR